MSAENEFSLLLIRGIHSGNSSELPETIITAENWGVSAVFLPFEKEPTTYTFHFSQIGKKVQNYVEDEKRKNGKG